MYIHTVVHVCRFIILIMSCTNVIHVMCINTHGYHAYMMYHTCHVHVEYKQKKWITTYYIHTIHYIPGTADSGTAIPSPY